MDGWLMFAGGAAIGLVTGLFLYRAIYQSDLRRIEESLTQTFELASVHALDANTERFLGLAKKEFEQLNTHAQFDLEKRQHAIHSLVMPVHQTLQKFEEKIQQVEKDRAKTDGELKQQVSFLLETERQLKHETTLLVQALRGTRMGGRWGELQLRRVVELADMVSHCDFIEQVSMDTQEGRLRPDMVVYLPGNKQVVVDAKVVIDAYLEAVHATDERQRKESLVLHARHVRERVLELSRKAYWEQFDASPDFVVLFLPGESIFSAALQAAPDLLEQSIEKRVIIATPTTLVALLKSVAYGWRQVAVEANAAEVHRLGKELYERICNFTGHFEKVGQQLTQAVSSYNQAVGSLESRMLVTARRFHELEASNADKELERPEPINLQVRPLQERSEAYLDGHTAADAPV